MPANHFGDGVASGSTLIEKKDRWSDATVAGGLTAAAGGGLVMHGYESEGNARMRVATATADRARAQHDMGVADEKLNRYREGLKVDRAMGAKPTKEQIAAEEKPLKRSYGHAKGRLTTHERTITQQTARAVGARRVKRIGSGVLGAGASLGVLGAVMTERKRRPKVPKPMAAPAPSAPNTPAGPTPLSRMKQKRVDSYVAAQRRSQQAQDDAADARWAAEQQAKRDAMKANEGQR